MLLFISDAALYMNKAEQILFVLCHKMICTCVARAFHCVAEVEGTITQRKSFGYISETVFLKAPSRVNVLKEMYYENALPSRQILTKWDSWLEVVEYYAQQISIIIIY